ncbi:SDR family NAD(P)-dependent oxidoreductase [Pseudomarimonas salicorniae]|uniref:SDR family NAD(P)-dependent oxidoreductase n=1 Tax=Pseudomarimonas salicorniae TaxID=2933270 RepID=A0ABT0GCC0_9GAMM|nr:SDR family NAD(P)-dependent oxidoreductase [Lysobacter sp. CAU 1642]MCK7592188.1 SDR family NAD(P)-dependent oxidoreductase [Lysobacter sp. CAU 1642]
MAARSGTCPPTGSLALVTGASSGIGLAAVTQLLESRPAGRVLAVSRRASGCAALDALESAHPGRLLRRDVDLSEAAAIDDLPASIDDDAGRLDLVFHCAGLLHDADMNPEKSLAQLDATALARSFALNAFAPVLLLRALLPRLKTAGQAHFASLSARVGSISDNRLGGWYSYRAAKAAQNQLLKTAAIELRRSARGLCVVMLHPGTVDTPLSAPFQGGVPADRLFTPERAARQLLGIIESLGPEDSGRFVAWDGRDVPW